MTIEPHKYEYADDVLKDRIILITGASDGIGKALALHAAALGAQVILHGRNTRKLEAVYDDIEALDGARRPSIAVLDLAKAGGEEYATLTYQRRRDALDLLLALGEVRREALALGADGALDLLAPAELLLAERRLAGGERLLAGL